VDVIFDFVGALPFREHLRVVDALEDCISAENVHNAVIEMISNLRANCASTCFLLIREGLRVLSIWCAYVRIWRERKQAIRYYCLLHAVLTGDLYHFVGR